MSILLDRGVENVGERERNADLRTCLHPAYVTGGTFVVNAKIC